MRFLENEKKLWESGDKRFILTTHRLREVNKTIFGSGIKSIMLEELTSCELHSTSQIKFLRQALYYFLLINASVYLLNNFLFEAELVKLFFGKVHIDSKKAGLMFYLSIAVSSIYGLLFLASFQKVFSFHAPGMNINIQKRWLSFEEREGFISMVEQAKDKRRFKRLNENSLNPQEDSSANL